MSPYPFDFLDCIDWIKPIEGGYWAGGPTDPNPTNLGITQAVLLRVRQPLGIDCNDVKYLTQDEANLIYYRNYWTLAGCSHLVFPLYLIVFDTSVNCGVYNATFIETSSKGKATSYMDIRNSYYERVATLRPALAPNLKGWHNRLNKLAVRCKLSWHT